MDQAGPCLPFTYPVVLLLQNVEKTPKGTIQTKPSHRIKNGKTREVPLERGLADKLIAWQEKNPTSILVFPTVNNKVEGPFLRIGYEIAERAGISPDKFWLQKFRDTSATWSSLAEPAASFRKGRFSSAAQITGTWVEIGELSNYPSSPLYGSLNCSGVSRGSKFEFVLVANGHSVELHAVGMTDHQEGTMEPNHKGSVEFREVDFGGEGTLQNYRCRITNRGTLACLIGSTDLADHRA
jgi:hypothetical protein